MCFWGGGGGGNDLILIACSFASQRGLGGHKQVSWMEMESTGHAKIALKQNPSEMSTSSLSENSRGVSACEQSRELSTSYSRIGPAE